MENQAATVDKAKELKSQHEARENEKATTSGVDQKIAAALEKLPPEDRELAASQQFCPVLDKSRLGSMGVPIKVMIDGEPVFLEVNVSPGMTETSAVPLAIETAGWSLGKMCADLVYAAAARGGRAKAISLAAN